MPKLIEIFNAEKERNPCVEKHIVSFQTVADIVTLYYKVAGVIPRNAYVSIHATKIGDLMLVYDAQKKDNVRSIMKHDVGLTEDGRA